MTSSFVTFEAQECNTLSHSKFNHRIECGTRSVVEMFHVEPPCSYAPLVERLAVRLWVSQERLVAVFDAGALQSLGQRSLAEALLSADCVLTNVNEHVDLVGSQNMEEFLKGTPFVSQREEGATVWPAQGGLSHPFSLSALSSHCRESRWWNSNKPSFEGWTGNLGRSWTVTSYLRIGVRRKEFVAAITPQIRNAPLRDRLTDQY